MSQNIMCSFCGVSVRYDPEGDQRVCTFCNRLLDFSQLLDTEDLQYSQEEDDPAREEHDSLTEQNDFKISFRQEVIKDAKSPEYFIPFKVNKKMAIKIYKKNLGQAVFVHRVFKKKKYLKDIKGYYVPFELHDAQVQAKYEFLGSKIKSIYKGNTEYIIKTNYQLHREASLHFLKVPVLATNKFESQLIDAIEPFNPDELERFFDYGGKDYIVEKRTDSKSLVKMEAVYKIDMATYPLMYETVSDYKAVEAKRNDTNVHHEVITNVLLPVWILDIS